LFSPPRFLSEQNKKKPDDNKIKIKIVLAGKNNKKTAAEKKTFFFIDRFFLL